MIFILIIIIIKCNFENFKKFRTFRKLDILIYFVKITIIHIIQSLLDRQFYITCYYSLDIDLFSTILVINYMLFLIIR